MQFSSVEYMHIAIQPTSRTYRPITGITHWHQLPFSHLPRPWKPTLDASHKWDPSVSVCVCLIYFTWSYVFMVYIHCDMCQDALPSSGYSSVTRKYLSASFSGIHVRETLLQLMNRCLLQGHLGECKIWTTFYKATGCWQRSITHWNLSWTKDLVVQHTFVKK